MFSLSLEKLRATADANARELLQYSVLHQQRGLCPSAAFSLLLLLLHLTVGVAVA